MLSNFGVLLFKDSIEHLEPLAASWVKQSDEHRYFLAKSIDTTGVYLHMVIEDDNPDDDVIDIDLYIPHHFVRAIIQMNGLKRIGFV